MQPIRLLSFLITLCVGGFFGGIAVPSIVVAFMTLLNPKVWRDGQAGMLLVLPVPTGVIVGATIAAVMMLSLSERNTAAAITLIAVGAVLTLLNLLIAVTSREWAQFVSPLFGWAGLWGIAFLVVGISWLTKH